MKIVDLNGIEIEITDLNGAIAQAKLYKGFRHENRSFLALDDQLQAYWTDLYEKLTAIGKQIGERGELWVC